MRNRYKLLEVGYFDPEPAIRAAHKDLTRRNHPDVKGSSKEADEKTALLNDARDVLVKPDQRFAHNLELLTAALPFHPIAITAAMTKMMRIPESVVFTPMELWDFGVKAALTVHDMFTGGGYDQPRLSGERREPAALLTSTSDLR